MKVIDILNKIANEEEVPKKIKIGNREYLYDKYSKWYFYGKTTEDMFVGKERLNDEVEIIEEDNKIEKLIIYDDSINWCCNGKAINDIEKDIIDKLNEIIDYINKENK